MIFLIYQSERVFWPYLIFINNIIRLYIFLYASRILATTQNMIGRCDRHFLISRRRFTSSKSHPHISVCQVFLHHTHSHHIAYIIKSFLYRASRCVLMVNITGHFPPLLRIRRRDALHIYSTKPTTTFAFTTPNMSSLINTIEILNILVGKI